MVTENAIGWTISAAVAGILLFATQPVGAGVTIYENGKIYTGAALGTAEAMAIRDDKIVAVGSTDEV